MRRSALAMLVLVALAVAPAARADHSPSHDTRPNPNCAYDTERSADYDGDGEPDHMVTGVSHNTSFPRQVVVVLQSAGVPIEQIPPFFGGHEGPDNVTFVMQGDHRMLGANPAHQDNGEPEQLHNGAIYGHVDYDDVERGRAPRAEWGFGIYEANHLVMVCGATDEDTVYAVCPNGTEVVNESDVECPQG